MYSQADRTFCRNCCLIVVAVFAFGLTACGREPAAVVGPPVSGGPIVVRGRVDVEGGLLTLGAGVDGVVDGISIQEGDRVAHGQVLITLDQTPAHVEEASASAHLQAAVAQLDLLRGRLAAARTHAYRLREAARLHAGDGQSADDALASSVELAAQVRGAQAAIAVARADLTRTRYQAGQGVLRSPVDGSVVRLTAWHGMRVSPQTSGLLTLLPDKGRIVRAELPRDVIDAVYPGEAGQVLSDDGSETVLGSARVLRIAQTYGQSSLQADPLQRVSELSVECVLGLASSPAPRVGERVLVRFLRAAGPGGERSAKRRDATLSQ